MHTLLITAILTYYNYIVLCYILYMYINQVHVLCVLLLFVCLCLHLLFMSVFMHCISEINIQRAR